MLALLGLTSPVVLAIQLGILDDFEGAAPMSCATDGWSEGPGSINPPTGELMCGELGTCCLVNSSAGGFGPGSRQVTFNESQWTGDYLSAGVNRIQLQAANTSSDEVLHLRVGVTNSTTCYVSAEAVEIPPNDPTLQFMIFLLDPTTMTEVSGNLCGAGEPLETVLSNVTQLRIISSASPVWSGDEIVSTVHFDAIQSKADTDLDSVTDAIDNCTLVPNPEQTDTDGDGYGNPCDADLDNDCIVNPVDLGLMKAVFFSNDPDADLNIDGDVNFLDLGILKSFFFGEPGPGLGVCGACEPPDPIGTNDDFAGLPMFMRGGLINDWGATLANQFSDQTGGLYVARFETSAGSFEWKIADENWSIEYCTITNLVENTPTSAFLFGCLFPSNGTIDVPATGCYEFRMQTDGNVPPNEVEVIFEQLE